MEQPLGISLIDCGWDFRHLPGFAIDRPQGRSDWGLMVFTTSGRCRDGNGFRRVPPGTCLVFPPRTPQHYGSDGGVFANHWCHWDGPAAAGLAAALALPVAGPAVLADPAAVAQAIHGLEREHHRREPGWEAACAAAVVAVLVAVGRGCRAPGRGGGDHALRDLRAAMLARPTAAWTVAGLARRAGLSPSRFAARYRAAFAVSPIADLIRARVARARLLLESGASVAAAAAGGGFADLPYFHRQFRRLVGCTPAAFRTGARAAIPPSLGTWTTTPASTASPPAT